MGDDSSELGVQARLPGEVAGAICRAAARILKLPLDEVSVDRSLFSHGLNSLGAVQLCDELAAQHGIKIPVAWIWAYATPRHLAEALAASLSSPRPAATAATQAFASQPAAAAPNHEPIAIVGIGCRLPGGVDSPRELWAALRSGRNGIVEAPHGRPDVAAGWGAHTLSAEGGPRLGGFLSDIAEFDAAFFGISPAEARQMDPQQRLALETTWSALEDACIVPATLRRSRTGVFYGVVWREYEALLRSPESLTTHTTVGGENSIIAARVAYVLDLRGPALTINTACSSSLVALHLTMHSLRRGEIDVGLAGGVNLLLSAKTTAGLVRFGGLSPTSESRPFDAGANGYVRGEGSCVFVLRRLSDARRDGQRIYAVLLASATNNDGASNGLTAPNPEAQSEVIRACWAEAGVPLHAVEYVEAHGTGTALGDPIEALALSQVFAEERSAPLLIGSLKGSIGHLEGASGAAGLAKVVLSLKHRVLPAQLGYVRPNPRIDFEGLKLRVVDRERDWTEPPDGGARHAGISSFGWGGTNAHVAVEEAPGGRREQIPVSGADEEALRRRARAYLESRDSGRAWPLGDPTDLVRFVARGHDRREALAALEGVANSAVPVAKAGREAARMAWLFSGFGSHWPGMGMDLLASEGTFRRTLVECDAAARAVAGAPFLDELTRWQSGAPPPRPTPLFSMVFSVQLGMARVLAQWGLRPEVVFGQSLGEWAAAAFSGALSLEDGMRVVTACQTVCDKLSGRGSVFLVELSLARAEGLLAARRDTVQLIGTLGPHQVNLGGAVDDVARLRAELAQEGVRTWSIGMDYAPHTRLMEEGMAEYRALLTELRPRRAQLPLWSTTVGGFVSGEEMNAEYWVRHLCEPVRLTHAIQTLARSATCFVEIAPHPVVSRALEASLEEAGGRPTHVFCTGRRDTPARETLEELASALWCNGASVEWDRVTGTARDTAWPLVISGRDEPSLRRQAGRWATWLEREAKSDWLSVTRGAALKRTHFEWRASVIARDADEGAASLRALCEGRSDAALVRGNVDPLGGGGVTVLFTGQGSQRPGMGRELYERCPEFRAGLDEVLAALAPHLDVDLKKMMHALPESGAGTRLDDTEYTQPALFAFEVALYRQWLAWGIQPSVVLGHSVGELGAAYASGVLSLEDAARLVCARGRRMQHCRADGAMASIRASADEVARLLENHPGVVIAGLNAPAQTVISGDAGAVDAVKREFELAGKRVTALRVSHAFHSHHMDGMLDAYRQEARRCHHRPAATAWLRLVNGSWLSPGENVDPEYWVDQARRPVDFVGGMRALEARGMRTFLECGPDAVLTGLGMQCLAGGRFVASVRRQADEHVELLKALSELHVHGHEPSWAHVFEQAGEVSPELPTYEFSRNRHWLGRTEDPAQARSVGMEAEAHAILRARTQVAGDVPLTLLSGVLDTKDQTWLSAHKVHGGAVFPGTGFLELALAAAARDGEVRELTLTTPLPLPEDGATRVQVKLVPGPIDGQQLLEIHTRPDQGDGPAVWTRHAVGLLAVVPTQVDAEAFRGLSKWPVPGAERVELTGVYEALHDYGLDYGSPFRGLRELWRDEHAMYALVDVPPGLDLESYGVHPALLDAALHALASGSGGFERAGNAPFVPYEWCAVRLYRRGAGELRVKLTFEAEGQGRVARLVAVDGQGLPVLHVGALRLRRWSTVDGPSLATATRGELHRLIYAPIALGEFPVAPRSQDEAIVVHAALGPGRLDAVLSIDGERGSFEDLLLRIESGGSVPRRVWVDATGLGSDGADLRASAHRMLTHAQACLQRWYRTPRTAECELVWVTRGALATGPDDGAVDLVNGSVLGMIRALRAEHSERPLRFIDVGSQAVTRELLVSALQSSEKPELALRDGLVLASQLAPLDAESDALLLPATEPWQLDIEERGQLDRIRYSIPRREGGLAPGQIRVAVRAAGINFRDLLHALDMVHAPAFGLECAGVVVELGTQVHDLRVGDRVMGMALGCFGSDVRADARTMVKIPAGLTYAQAATIPVAFATALHGLRDLGRLQRGQRVLVHAATGGVGMAAVQIARVLGAEVFGTASEGKWEHLRAQGLDPAHIASSRHLAFERKWLEHTLGEGVDVVLNALSGAYVDASLRLLPRGGRFVEMGKTDPRDPESIAAAYPGVSYQTFDLLQIGPERTAELLREVVGLLEGGRIGPLPLQAYDVRYAPQAFRFMARARHVGKLVLTVPRALDAGGTVLVTGATGQLGRLITEHLVTVHGIRHLLLTSRRGAAADGASAWLETLRRRWGCHAQVASCDVSDRDDLRAALGRVDPAHPLTGVFHLAGVLEDGAFEGQTPASLTRVLKPKLDGSLWLDELTQTADLSAFVLFSSVAAALGNPGQTNYAAANAFMDALASARRARGQPALSLAWGLWQSAGDAGEGMGAHLDERQLARLRRSGVRPMELASGLQLLDQALGRPESYLVPAALDRAALKPHAERGAPARGPDPGRANEGLAKARSASPASWGESLRQAPERERVSVLVSLVREAVASVLGLPSVTGIPVDRPLAQLGLDSLTSVELRRRLAAHAVVDLPASLVFDYPTVTAVAKLLLQKLAPAPIPTWTDAEIRAKLARVSLDSLRSAGFLEALMQQPETDETETTFEHDIQELDHASVLEALDELLK